MARESAIRELITDREIRREPTTERTKMLRKRFLQEKLTVCTERAFLFTEAFKKGDGLPIMVRRAEAFKYYLSNMKPIIRDGELIVGNYTRFVRGAALYPDGGVKWIKDVLKGILSEAEQKYVELPDGGGIVRDFVTYRLALSKKEEEKLWEVLDYWDGKSFDCMIRKYFEKTDSYALLKELESTLTISPFITTNLCEGRMVLDYEKVLNKGFNGIIEEINEKLRELRRIGHRVRLMDDMDKIIFYESAISSCEGVIALSENYASEAERLARNEKNRNRKDELMRIAGACRWVPANPARNLYEALQSWYFTHMAGFLESGGAAYSPARFDQYMYPFYKKDIEENKITRSEALELLECLRLKIAQYQYVTTVMNEGLFSGTTNQNLVLGGCTKDGKPADNDLSTLILESAITMQTNQPTLSIRYNDKLNEDFLLKAIELVKTGIGMPAWFNDEVGIAHALSHTGASLEDARDWALGGCVEQVVSHRRGGFQLSFYTNLGKTLELALNNGIDPVSRKRVGIETGDPQNMSYDELVDAWKKQTAYVYHLAQDYWNMAMGLHPHILPLPYASVLTDDCIERGKSLDEGGARYSDGPTHLITGLIDVANSFAAIKKCVFEDKVFTMGELINALNRDFKGYEDIQRKLIDASKFGNDDDYVDDIAQDLYGYLAEESLSHKNWFGHPIPPAPATVTTHPIFGKACGALPEGRKKGIALCDGSVSALPGTDKNGPTALVNSASKVDAIPYSCHLLNIKFHPTALKDIDGSRKLLALIKTYMDRGGYHVQFNVVDTKMLRDAQRRPEDYQDLWVRVAGFSMRWVELSRAVQDEIIRRTEYEEC
jgi:formate C-acetyltransferase/4-hydroxyphenylacetate decarboxylase large subunit